ncbi:hypothetical protein HPB50_007516 [Hyalomma asiaticum]|uniref:Uncharacterized protein n=1 Tax=Hyalomma asiaticum TaxID=266040 RepID=A0ACB7TG13_HYAAI|nr:hypothetical protein HPB50_007516 [Hyalomma asiaticum]
MVQHQTQTPSPSQTTPASDASGEPVSAVTVRLPPCWECNTAMWFSQVESQFQLSGITSKQRPLHYVVGALPSTAAEEVAEILLSFGNNPPVRPYSNFQAAGDSLSKPTSPPFLSLNAFFFFQAALLGKTAASQRTRIQRLLSSEELADRRSSQLSWQMRQLLGTSAQTSDNAVPCEHFLQRLPSQVQIVLAPETAMDFVTLSTLGDRIMTELYAKSPIRLSQHAHAVNAADRSCRDSSATFRD